MAVYERAPYQRDLGTPSPPGPRRVMTSGHSVPTTFATTNHRYSLCALYEHAFDLHHTSSRISNAVSAASAHAKSLMPIVTKRSPPCRHVETRLLATVTFITGLTDRSLDGLMSYCGGSSGLKATNRRRNRYSAHHGSTSGKFCLGSSRAQGRGVCNT
jgi:hypothetical protein